MGLVAKKFQRDQRVVKAKRLLKAALFDAQKKLKGLKPPDRARARSYQRLLKNVGQWRGGNLYFPYLASGIGKGPLVELADGSVKYDFITGIGVHYLGHSHPQLLESSIEAALEDTIMQGNLQQSVVTADLLKLLVQTACRKGAKLKHCFLTSSGAMANENAFKIIFQKNSPANRLLAFKDCFSGRTLVAGQMTDRPANRQGLPKILNIDYIPFFDDKNPKQSTARAVKRLKYLLKKNKGKYAAMTFELIQGEAGARPGRRDFFVALMKILRKENIAVMADEIQTFGRTSSPFAFQYFGLDKYVDVVTVGKMAQVCATLFTDRYNPKPGLLSQTFTSSTAAIYAARAILNELLKGGYLGPRGKINKYSKHFMKNLTALSKKYPRRIKGPFGCGAMIAMTVFDGTKETASAFTRELFKNGVLSFMAGVKPVRVRFLIPVGAVSLKDIDAVCGIIEKTLKNRGQRPISSK